jgi:hypothetical protein
LKPLCGKTAKFEFVSAEVQLQISPSYQTHLGCLATETNLQWNDSFRGKTDRIENDVYNNASLPRECDYQAIALQQ